MTKRRGEKSEDFYLVKKMTVRKRLRRLREWHIEKKQTGEDVYRPGAADGYHACAVWPHVSNREPIG